MDRYITKLSNMNWVLNKFEMWTGSYTVDESVDHIIECGGEIYGEYVYKYLVNKDTFSEINVMYPTGYLNRFIKNLNEKIFNIRYNPNIKIKYIYPEFDWEEYSDPIIIEKEIDQYINRKKKLDGKNVSFEIKHNTIKEQLPRDMVNSLIYNKYGIRDIDNNKKRQEFIIENLKKKRYCPFEIIMSSKDKAYFNNWEIIEMEECSRFDVATIEFKN